MSVECFLDTNVFIYLFDDTDPRKQGVAEGLIERHLEGDSACISHQVVQETLNVMNRKLGASAEQCRSMLDRVLVPLWRVYPTPELYRLGLDLQTRYACSFYDSLILAAALQAGCRTLFTEDLQHGQDIEGLRIENPFLTETPTPAS